MSIIYSKTSMVLKNPSVFFEEVRGEKLRPVMKFLAVLPMIPAVYVRGTGKIGVADPLDDSGRHQLVRMMKSPHVTTKILDDGGKAVEAIDKVAVLKRGSASENWGWEPIVDRDHHNQIRAALDLPDNDATVKAVISEVLEYGTVASHIPGDTIKITRTVTRNSNSKQ